MDALKRLALPLAVAFAINAAFYFTVMKLDNPPPMWVFFVLCVMTGVAAGSTAARGAR